MDKQFTMATKIIFPSLWITGLGIGLIIVSLFLFAIGIWIVCLGTCGAKI